MGITGFHSLKLNVPQTDVVIAVMPIDALDCPLVSVGMVVL